MVLSKDDETGEVAYKEVLGLFKKQADQIYTIHIGEEIIEVTGDHPFWLDGQGWTLVKELRVGDLLVSSEGSKLAITEIEKEPRQTIVYNFEVKDFNSYFVSDLGVWVHNCAVGGTGKLSGTHGELTSQKVRDSHHIIQDAAVRDLPGYNRNSAPAIHLQGPNKKGTEHYIAGKVQRQAGGGTHEAERRIGYKAMRRAGVSEQQARNEITRSDKYFSSIGVKPNTQTRIPGNRR